MPRPARLTPPTSPGSVPRMHGRLALLPGEAGRTAGGAFSCTGAPQPIPAPEPMQACRASQHISGARPRPTGRPHEAPHAPIARRAARDISACHGQGCDTADTTGQPARSSPPGRPPPPAQKSPRPKATLGYGLKKSRCRFASVLLRCSPAAGDVGLDAEHDAHGEDADDCGDAGGRRVQRDLSALSLPPTRPASHSQGCAPPTLLSRLRPVPGTFSSHTT